MPKLQIKKQNILKQKDHPIKQPPQQPLAMVQAWGVAEPIANNDDRRIHLTKMLKEMRNRRRQKRLTKTE